MIFKRVKKNMKTEGGASNFETKAADRKETTVVEMSKPIKMSEKKDYQEADRDISTAKDGLLNTVIPSVCD